MSKKFLRNQEVTASRQLAQNNSNKIYDIKQLSSPYKKAALVHSKLSTNLKTSNSNNNAKQVEEDSKISDDDNLSKQKSKIKEQKHTSSTLHKKDSKRVVSPLLTSQNAKRFSKTSKIPTLKSITAKGTTDESECEYSKNSDSKIFTQESLSQKIDLNEQKELAQLELSALKLEVEIYKTQNDELKRQNYKLVKKIEKLKSLNDENKKLLKERIENFNSEGQKLRNLRQQITELENYIVNLKAKIVDLEEANRFLNENIQKINTPKVSREIQTIILEQFKEAQNPFGIPLLNPQKQMKLEKKYQSSSSRKSYGGDLPLETVLKSNAAKLNIQYKSNESTPKKNVNAQQKLMDKYENYWSEKFKKEPSNVKSNEDGIENLSQARSQVMVNAKRLVFCEQENNIEGTMELELMTNKEKIGNKIQEGQSQSLNQLINHKQPFSPTILIENYRKISEQEELIQSLYKVVDKLSKQIEDIQKRSDNLETQNRELKMTLKRIKLEKQVIQKVNNQANPSPEYNAIEELKDDTLLLDQTRQYKPEIDLKQKKKLTSAQRINKLLIFQNFDPENLEQKVSFHKILKAQSVKDHNNKQAPIIDEISRFVHSEVLYHDSGSAFWESEPNADMSFEAIEQTKNKLENRSSTKEDDIFKNLDELDRNILTNNFDNDQMKAIVEKVQERRRENRLKDLTDFDKIQKNKEDEIQSIEQVYYCFDNIEQEPLQPQLKIQDSLDALQYFSNHTPEDIDFSQNVSVLDGLSFNQLNANQESQQNKEQQNFLKFEENSNHFEVPKAKKHFESIKLTMQSLIKVQEDQIKSQSSISLHVPDIKQMLEENDSNYKSLNSIQDI